MITKQIYIAMKKYDLIYVYKLQKYIMNCNEIKVMLIKKIFCDLVIYYNNSSKIKLLIKQINKLDILNSLVVKRLQSYQVNNILIEYIKQHLIYKSIEPTWKAKISKKSIKFINNIQLKNIVSSYNKINNKYFLTKIVINKLSSYNYFNKSISIWLYQNVCINLSKIHNLKYKEYIVESRNNRLKFITKISGCLYFLVNNIIVNDLYWYKFNYIRKEDRFYKSINDTGIAIFQNSMIINKLLRTFNLMFKELLYRKTYKGFNKINLFDNKNLNKINFLFKYYYSNIISFISLSLIESCNKLINYFSYVLIKKNINRNLSKSEYIYNLKLINQILNKYIYFCNIEYFHKQIELVR
uniref:hypothetical protein orf353 n=1 Tax=Amplisiphonia pacifica TaxID=1563190 RepID=UPI0022FD6B52|nr:hypothetical protein orf353 [Amplisiphonia pacifica]WAX03270.1 hypothetical protein orf353 [Amplisiphonia pacifica]